MAARSQVKIVELRGEPSARLNLQIVGNILMLDRDARHLIADLLERIRTYESTQLEVDVESGGDKE